MKTKSLLFIGEKTKEVVFLLSLLFVATFIPLLGNQAVTGPIVNATLFLAVYFVGVKGAMAVAVLPSVVALGVGGLLPPAAFPMVPFIMIANIVLVLVFNRFSGHFWKGVFIASFCKFVFLSFVSLVVFGSLLAGVVPEQVIIMMSWPQFLTALFGGAIAYGVEGFFKI